MSYIFVIHKTKKEMKAQLNANEQLVLDSLNEAANACTGGEFGFTNDVNKCGMSDNQFAGYLSALQEKGIVTIEKCNDSVAKMFEVNEDYK